MNFRIENAFQTTRRGFLKGGAGLALAIVTPVMADTPAAGPGLAGSTMVDGEFSPSAFIRIGTDGMVTIVSKHLEMGQGVYTGLATLVAEELDADWSKVKVEGAPADAKRYNNLFWGPAQGTGGSTAIANSFEQMRRAGATARAMLVAAAAKEWKVPASQITVKNGVVSHAASGRKAGFGELAEAAAQLPVPANVKLKNPKDFTLIGRSAPRVDSVAKTTGRATFTQDVKLPGMLVAVVAHPPRFGGRVKSVDDKAARAIKGVSDVVVIPNGVAVLASDYWTAKKGRDALKVEWDESKAEKRGSEALMAEYRKHTPGLVSKFGGKFIVRGGNCTSLEGGWTPARVVVLDGAHRDAPPGQQRRRPQRLLPKTHIRLRRSHLRRALQPRNARNHRQWHGGTSSRHFHGHTAAQVWREGRQRFLRSFGAVVGKACGGSAAQISHCTCGY